MHPLVLPSDLTQRLMTLHWDALYSQNVAPAPYLIYFAPQFGFLYALLLNRKPSEVSLHGREIA